MKICQTLSVAALALVLSSPTFAAEKSTNQSVVNINTANIDQLVLIKGIGERKAEAIVDYREKNGPYTTINDLDNVQGISQNQVDAWSPLLAVK